MKEMAKRNEITEQGNRKIDVVDASWGEAGKARWVGDVVHVGANDGIDVRAVVGTCRLGLVLSPVSPVHPTHVGMGSGGRHADPSGRVTPL